MLAPLNLTMDVRPVDLDESARAGEVPEVYVERLAREKAVAAQPKTGQSVILGGDTIVTLDGQLLGKPSDEEHAHQMLSQLSGREHAVVSGWAVIGPDGTVESGTETAWVRFESLSNEDITRYVSTGEPMDKAGGYGIQGQGGELVAGYRGDFTTIVGFPMMAVLKSLGRIGVVPNTDLFRRYATVMGRVSVAAEESERSVSAIRVIAASKAQEMDRVREIYSYGHRDFGESYVQELAGKVVAMPEDVHWHFIGHLQRNKVRDVVPCVHSVQTVSSLKLAQKLSAKAVALHRDLECLIQVNLGAEETKSGVAPPALPELLKSVVALPNLRVTGLMCIPPRSGLAQARRWFRQLRSLRDELRSEEHPLPELSMGMSGDFDGAIMEGATSIRVGTALFGPRPNS